MAPLYDLSMWFVGLFLGGEERIRRRVLAELGPPGEIEGKDVLELFCGTATFSLMAAKLGAHVTGMDLSRGMLKVARQKSLKECIRLDLVMADSAALPVRDNAFDAVIMSLGMHEVTADDAKRVVREVHRVLKQRGRALIFDFHGAGGAVGFFQRILLPMFEEPTVTAWLATDVQGLLREAGFKNFKRKFLVKGALQIITVER